MKINIDNFKDIIKKSTLNFTLDSTQIIFTEHNIVSKLASNVNNPIVIINTENNVLFTSEEKKWPDSKFEFNFDGPYQSVLPYLNLIENEYADILIKKERITLISDNQKSDIFFCSPRRINVFLRDSARDDLEYFSRIPIDDSFVHDFNKLKRIGQRFGKIYFGVNKNRLLMETTDKQNMYANSMKFYLSTTSSEEDLSMCFDYKNIVNMFTIIDDNYTDYEMNLSYLRDKNMGLMYIRRLDDTEKYYFMSMRDTE